MLGFSSARDVVESLTAWVFAWIVFLLRSIASVLPRIAGVREHAVSAPPLAYSLVQVT